MYIQNRNNNTVPYEYVFFLSALNSNFILLADFPFMRPFQCPVYLSCIIIKSASIISISFIYFSNFENSSK